MKNRRMRTRMYGGVRGRKTKKVGRNSKIFVFLLLDYCACMCLIFSLLCEMPAVSRQQA